MNKQVTKNAMETKGSDACFNATLVSVC